jgi:hypothetical protein
MHKVSHVSLLKANNIQSTLIRNCRTSLLTMTSFIIQSLQYFLFFFCFLNQFRISLEWNRSNFHKLTLKNGMLFNKVLLAYIEMKTFYLCNVSRQDEKYLCQKFAQTTNFTVLSVVLTGQESQTVKRLPMNCKY